MATMVENINSLLNTKEELKNILIDNGVEDVGDVFSSYPALFRELIESLSQSQNR